MAEIISTQPRLYDGDKPDAESDSLTVAHVNRLLSLEQSIGRRPEIYAKAFADLGETATELTLGLKDDSIEVRAATSDPKTRIQEFFAKRDDRELLLDPESDRAIYGSDEFKRLADVSASKRSITLRRGAMSSEQRTNPEAQAASNAVRRYILGAYIGRVVAYSEQHSTKRTHRAG